MAVSPPTATSTPGTLPTVLGTRSSRIVVSASTDGWSVPLPAIGIMTCATVLFFEIVTSVASVATLVAGVGEHALAHRLVLRVRHVGGVGRTFGGGARGLEPLDPAGDGRGGDVLGL